MSPTEIICLANSKKYGERCIAGIDKARGRWIRPVSAYSDGKVPKETRLLGGNREPALLDILEIPLNQNYDDTNLKCEDRTIINGEWLSKDKADIRDLIRYINFDSPILHNSNRYVAEQYLYSLPFHQRQSLQIIYVDSLNPEKIYSKWKATLRTRANYEIAEITITDPEFLQRLNNGYSPTSPCLVTVSLSNPFIPPDLDWEGSPPCWKLIAGIVELSLSDQILIEMHFAHWDILKGKDFIVRTFGKALRQDLSQSEKLSFLQHLKTLHSKNSNF